MKRELSFRMAFSGMALPSHGEHKFYFVNKDSIEPLWQYLEPIFLDEPEIWHLGQTLESLKYGLEQDAFFLLIGADWKDWVKFIAIVCIEKYPAQKVLNIPAATGFDMSSYIEELVDAIDYLAFRLDCDSKLVTGRNGWERVLMPYGYMRESVRLISSVDRRSYH